MKKYDIKAKVINLRESGNCFASGYRPVFQVTNDYMSSGEIELIGKDILKVGEIAEAYISFLTPAVYPYSMWVGRKLIFMEGRSKTGEAIIEEIYNDILLKK